MNTVTYESVEDYWQDFSQNYGPTRSLYESLGDRGEEMHQAWLDCVRRRASLHRAERPLPARDRPPDVDARSSTSCSG